MRTTRKAQPLRLTSQYVRGVRGADSAAMDAKGRDWYRAPDGAGDRLTDQDVPEWPPCVACGGGVDWTDSAHWYTGLVDTETLFLHDSPKCVVLVYPETESVR